MEVDSKIKMVNAFLVENAISMLVIVRNVVALNITSRNMKNVINADEISIICC